MQVNRNRYSCLSRRLDGSSLRTRRRSCEGERRNFEDVRAHEAGEKRSGGVVFSLLPPAPATQAGWKWMCRSLAPCWFFVVKLKERLRIDCEQFLRIILSPEPVSILAGEAWAQGSPRYQASPTKCMGKEARMNSRYPRRLDCLPINTTTTSLRCGRDFGWVEFLMFPRAAHFLLAGQFHLLSRGTQQENRALFVV